MEIYLVGGAVRDHLLGLPVKEKDWVVVGTTVQEMLRLGYKQVGKDFPVFLHPTTNEEYALARQERKTGPGYSGFAFDASPAVSLEQDLKRRDLTINAMAETTTGELIDFYHGQQDLAARLLRHVSAAFVEDPVRILRIARFMARFAVQGFKVAPETLALMRQMVNSGEVNALVAERVWKELERALQEPQPEAFFTTLADCGALAILFPTLSVTGPPLAALKQATNISADPAIRFAALLHAQTVPDIKQLADRYKIPHDYQELAILVASHIEKYFQVEKLTDEELLKLLQNTDAFRREERFAKFILTCEAVSQTCQPLPEYPQTKWLRAAYQAAKQVATQPLLDQGLQGKAFAEYLQQQRLAAIHQIRKR